MKKLPVKTIDVEMEVVRKPKRASSEPASLRKQVEKIKKREHVRALIEAEKAAEKPVEQIKDEIAQAVSRFRVVTEEEAKRLDALLAQQNQEIKERDRLRKWEEICPARYREPFDFKKVSADVNRDEIDKVMLWQFGDRGLYIVGPSGHSKTRAVYHRLREMYVEDRIWVKAIEGPLFATQGAAAFSEPAKTEAWLNQFFRPQVVFLDDLAKRWTPSTEEATFMILEHRTARLLPTIITINNLGGDLQAISTDQNVVGPLIRRIEEFCELVIF